MTEIPEHLLKRSKERRAAMGLGGESSGDAAPAAGTSSEAAAEPSGVAKPAVAPAAAAAPPPVAAAPPRRPDPPYVAAAKTRKKVPMWAAPVLAALPLWGFIYFQSLQKPPTGANDPLALGASIYTGKGGCAGCHGADGSGGVGAKLNGGEVQKTFKNPLAMVHWIAFGADGGARNNGSYGDVDRPGGAHNVATLPSAMPAQKDKLTSEELAAVTIYIRQTLSGGKPDTGFDVADFPTLGPIVDEVVALGPGGDPKVPGGSPTEAAGKGTSSSSDSSSGGSAGAGATGGNNKSRGTGTNSSGGTTTGGSSSSGTSSTGSGATKSGGSGGAGTSGGSDAGGTGGSGGSDGSGGSGGGG